MISEGINMFKQIKPNLVESDEGFSVETTVWRGITYTKSGNKLHVMSEFLVGPEYDIMVVASRIKKWDSGEIIDDSERKIIVGNIVRALHFQGMKVDVRW